MKTESTYDCKCEFCLQKFNDNQLTKTFNRLYQRLCDKCKNYIEQRIDENKGCSKYCIESGNCDNSCS